MNNDEEYIWEYGLSDEYNRGYREALELLLSKIENIKDFDEKSLVVLKAFIDSMLGEIDKFENIMMGVNG